MDSQLLRDCLRRLLPHVDATRIALTGGVAIAMHVDTPDDGQARGFAAQLSKASAETPVDEKHYMDATRLGAICGRDVPTLATSYLAKTLYSQDIHERCLRCEVSRDDAFPLATKRAIMDILGYV